MYEDKTIKIVYLQSRPSLDGICIYVSLIGFNSVEGRECAYLIAACEYFIAGIVNYR
jgi:hypothetical protein